jgi:hypothetical protein
MKCRLGFILVAVGRTGGEVMVAMVSASIIKVASGTERCCG